MRGVLAAGEERPFFFLFFFLREAVLSVDIMSVFFILKVTKGLCKVLI